MLERQNVKSWKPQVLLIVGEVDGAPLNCYSRWQSLDPEQVVAFLTSPQNARFHQTAYEAVQFNEFIDVGLEACPRK